MLNLFAWRMIGVAVLLGILSSSLFYYKGLSNGREELANYKLTVKAVGDAQEAKTKQVIMSQQLLTNEANDEANELRDALTTYFNDPRLQVPYSPGSRKLPSVPKTTGGINATSTERGPDSSWAEAKECVSAVSAAQDAMTILLWQKWADDNANLPY